MADFWKDKVVIVTGASSGVGRSCVEEMSARRAKVVLAARRLERMQEIGETLPRESTLIVQTDVGKQGQVEAMVRRTVVHEVERTTAEVLVQGFLQAQPA